MLFLSHDTTTQRVAALVVSIATQHDGKIDISPTASLVDSGLSSVAMVDLMLAVEREFDLTIPDREIDASNFYSMATLAALVDRCRTAAQGG